MRGCAAGDGDGRASGREIVRRSILTRFSIRKAPEAEAGDIGRVAKYSGYVSGIGQHVDCVDKAN